MERKIVLKKDLLDAFQKVGVKAGQTVMVHCSLSALGNGTVTFMRQRELVDFAVRWIGENRK